MINHVSNLLQCKGDQNTCVLADGQIVHAGELGRFGAVLGVLDCNRRLSE
jgi:hypothetical protein